MFTYEQFMMAIRWASNAAGVYLMSKGYGDNAIWTAAGGFVLSLAPFVWGMVRHTKVGTILAADSLPEVAGVITKATTEGVALAKAIPKETVVPTGTPTAAAIARAA